MCYNNELTLVGETETTILCGVKSVGRVEFYNAAQSGLNPEIIFVVHGYEYSGQQKVKYEGTTYKVVRTYAVSFEELELTCASLRR